MSKYIDVKEINSLIKSISNLYISDIYKEMYKIEVSENKNSSQYNDLMSSLKEKLDLEKQEYEKYNLTTPKMVEWREYLIKNRLNNNGNNIESVVELNYENSLIRRIISALNKKISLSKDDISNNLDSCEEIITFLKKIGIDDADKVVQDSFYFNEQISRSIYSDLLNAFIYIVNELQKKENYYNIKKYLLAIKYHLAYIDNEVEKNLISRNFEIDQNLYINSKVTADLIGIDGNMYELLKDSYNVDVCLYQIYKLLDTGDMIYGDLKESLSSVLRQCLLRASFVLLNDPVIEHINYEFHKHIESKDYLDIHKFDKISRQLLIN